jgi:pSer/pThr/pTyr-binding forkhead associated (FHA) protein
MSPPTSRLIVRMGPNPGMIFDLTKEITTLGRDVANDIVLGDPEVSRQHSRLTRTPGGYVLEDLGSTNGTFVNGDRLTSPRVLNPGDLIGLSEKVTLTFEMASPETAETVLSQASDTARAATVVEAAPQTPMAAATPDQFSEEVKELPRWRSPWVMAGCGCLVVVVVLGAILIYLDANYPDILYAPLRMLGF